MPALPAELEARLMDVIRDELNHWKANATDAQKAKDEEIMEQMQSNPEMM